MRSQFLPAACSRASESMDKHVTLASHDSVHIVIVHEFDTRPVPRPPRKLLDPTTSSPKVSSHENDGLPFFIRNYLQKGSDNSYHATCIIDGNTALHQAITYYGYTRVKLVRLLLEKGIDVNPKDSQGNTALHLAVDSSSNLKEEVVKLLLEHNVDVDVQNETGHTALHLVSKRGHETIARGLLGKSANVHARDSSGMTALHLATKGGYGSIIRLLLEHQADINSQDVRGLTALHIAGRLDDYTAITRLLLDNGADPNIQDVYGRTVFHIMIRNNNRAIVKLLQDSAASPDIPDRNGNTARSLDIHFHFETILFETRQQTDSGSLSTAAVGLSVF